MIKDALEFLGIMGGMIIFLGLIIAVAYFPIIFIGTLVYKLLS